MQLQEGDTVAVVGASGNVGKLVALRLSERFQVRGVVRNAARVRSFLPESVALVEADLVRGDEAALQDALRGVNAVVVCTGTTAFPTKAWSKDGGDVTSAVISSLVAARGSKDAALQALDSEGFNTPENVDADGTRKILAAWAAVAAPGDRKRFVLMSSVGVQRRAEMPFPVLNACGVLDAKSSAETALKEDAQAGGYTYTIVRPGQLFGGPYDNNYYLGTLFQLDKDAATQGVEVAAGDTLMGDTLRSTLAEVIAQVLETGAAVNTDFCVVNTAGAAPGVDELRESLGVL